MGYLGDLIAWWFGWNEVKYWDKGGHVRRVECYLEKLENVDIIVNSTDRSLNLAHGGAISNAILTNAGPRIQREINNKYPCGIMPGQIAVTRGYNLPYKFVYHCSLQDIKHHISHHEIRVIVTACLQTAAEMDNGPFSIAFPVIGTGAMKFHPRLLNTIYRTLLEFMHNKPGYLKLAYIVICPGNTQIGQYARNINPREEQKRITYSVSFPSSWPATEDICQIKLEPSDEDYLRVAAKFQATMVDQFTIIKIERIVNKRLYITSRWYRNKFSKPPTDTLWHGTKHDSVDGIIRYGFDWRLTTRTRFGKGCYFTDKAFYADSDDFSEPNDQGEKCMFLVDVTIGKTIPGNASITEANLNPSVQTAIGKYEHPNGDINIYVTFDDDQICPLFLVVYKRNN